MQEFYSCIDSRISQEDNDLLTQVFSFEEVKEAVFSMHPDKSPGPDGMNPTFYQRFWDIIGEDVVNECNHILLSGSVPQRLNDTFVVLIPKKKNPEYVTDMRPISLCNVLVKVITKTLANRMKSICL